MSSLSFAFSSHLFYLSLSVLYLSLSLLFPCLFLFVFFIFLRFLFSVLFSFSFLCFSIFPCSFSSVPFAFSSLWFPLPLSLYLTSPRSHTLQVLIESFVRQMLKGCELNVASAGGKQKVTCFLDPAPRIQLLCRSQGRWICRSWPSKLEVYFERYLQLNAHEQAIRNQQTRTHLDSRGVYQPSRLGDRSSDMPPVSTRKRRGEWKCRSSKYFSSGQSKQQRFRKRARKTVKSHACRRDPGVGDHSVAGRPTQAHTRTRMHTGCCCYALWLSTGTRMRTHLFVCLVGLMS